jgi:hypothetical protein
MIDFFKSLRRGPGDHRDVFAEFAVKLLFLVAAEISARKQQARLRVVR